MSDSTNANPAGGDDERGSEVDDYTGEVPRVDPTANPPKPGGSQPSGFGDGDIADVTDLAADDIAADEADPAATEAGDGDPVIDPADYSGEDIAVLIAERDQYRDAAVRLQADFENFRKRAANQSASEIDRATGRLAAALLPVLDAAESAYVQHPNEVGPLLNQMLVELKKHGLEALDLENQPFDPAVAESVTHQPNEGGDTIVAEVFRSGYQWKGKVLRAALVRTTD